MAQEEEGLVSGNGILCLTETQNKIRDVAFEERINRRKEEIK